MTPYRSDGTHFQSIAGVFLAVQGSILTLRRILKQALAQARAALNDNTLAASSPHFFSTFPLDFPCITSYELFAKAVTCTHRLQVAESLYGP